MRALGRIGREAASEPKKVFAVTAIVLAIAMAMAGASVRMEMGMTLYLEEGSQTMKNWEDLKAQDRGNNVFVVFDTADPSDPELLRAMDTLSGRYGDVDDISQVHSITDPLKRMNGGELPETRERARELMEKLPEDTVNNFVPNRNLAVVMATYGDGDAEALTRQFRSETESVALPPGTEVTVTGMPIFEDAAFGLMLPEMILLFSAAFLVIFGALYVLMRSRVEERKYVLLPLVPTMAALMVMMGAMGLLDYNFNAIMMGVMPVALGLGIEYGIQIQNRYIEERGSDADPIDAAGIATSTTGKALLFAMMTTAIGFISLLASPVPPTRQFGVTSAVAIVAAMAFSVTLMPAVLATTDRGRGGSDTSGDDGAVERGFHRMARDVICHRPFAVIALILVVAAAGAYAYPKVSTTQEMMDYWPQEMQETKDVEYLTDNVDSPKVLSVLMRDATAADAERVTRFVDLVERLPEVNYVATDPPLKDYGGGPVTIDLYVEDIEGEPVRTLIDEAHSMGELAGIINMEITGKPVLNRNVIENVTAGLTPMTILSFGLALGFLLIAYRSLRRSAALLGTVVIAVLVIAGAMYLLGVPWNPLTVTMASLTLGIGIDFGIHLFERFEEELEKGHAPFDASVTSVTRLGRPILGSGVTIIAGFGVLTLSRFPVLSNFGRTIVLSIAISLIATFTFLPALLAGAGHHVCRLENEEGGNHNE